MGYTLYR